MVIKKRMQVFIKECIMMDNTGRVSIKELINHIYSFMKNLSNLQQIGQNAILFNYNSAEEIAAVDLKKLKIRKMLNTYKNIYFLGIGGLA